MNSESRRSSERARALLPQDFVPFDRSDIEGDILARFRKIVSRHGERIAVDDGRRTLTYAELDAATDRLARAVFDRLGPGSEPVALLYKHGAPFHVAQFGVIKAGKFYASLDAELSCERLERLLRNLGARLLLCDSACERLASTLAASLPGSTVLDTEQLSGTDAGKPPHVVLTGESIAYVIYTSGSTGAPEGVVIDHRHVLHYTMNQTNGAHLRPEDRGSQISPLSSAACTGETFPFFLNGSGVFPFAVKNDGVTNVAALARWLRDKRISILVCVPVLFRLLAAHLGKNGQLPDMRLVRLSGDRILLSDVDLFKEHFPQSCLLRAAYGSSECHLVAEYFIDHSYAADRPAVPAGYAVEDTDLFVVDDNLERRPPGAHGEIAVRSKYLASGYWRNPQRTAERFLVDADDPKGKIYLTRDIGYLEPDGCLVHAGRADFRVKIYGKWVAVTDIEEALLGLPDVQQAVVVADGDGRHGNELVAYYTTRAGMELAPGALLKAFDGRVPAEVIPKRFIRLDEMPVTRSNKIDRRKLAELTKR